MLEKAEECHAKVTLQDTVHLKIGKIIHCLTLDRILDITLSCPLPPNPSLPPNTPLPPIPFLSPFPHLPLPSPSCNARTESPSSIICDLQIHCTMYTVQCTLHCTLYTVHCTLYTVHCALCRKVSVLCRVFSLQCVVCSFQCAVCSVQNRKLHMGCCCDLASSACQGTVLVQEQGL